MITERREWLRRFLVEHGVQTNEVQRSWMLLPCFLEVARRTGVQTFDLIELGPSAGLNLVWDRYRYRYEHGVWGREDSLLELSGEERRPVPHDLLGVQPRVRTRRGVDIAPVDVTGPDQALLLKSFVWADQPDRLDRLDRAIEAVRRDPPVLEAGDVVERLPELLGERQPGALTVVFETAVLGYVQARQRVVAALEEAGRNSAFAFVYTAPPEPGEHTHYGLWIRIWPEDEDVLAARAEFHGQWLEWLL